MSLINQMLKDLENRTNKPTQSEMVLTGLQSAVHPKPIKKKSVALQLAVVALIGIWVWNLAAYYRHNHPRSATVAPVPAAAPALAPTIVKPAAVAAPTTAEVQPMAGTLTGISMQTHGKMTYVRFLLDREVFYRVNSDPLEHSITLTLDNTALKVNLPPLDLASSALRDLQVRPANQGRLNIVLLLKPEAKLSNLELNKESKYPELQADFLLEKVTAEAKPVLQMQPPMEAGPTDAENQQPAGRFKKVALALSGEEEYQSALRLAEEGQLDKAIQRLAILVEKYPNDHVARESLIRFLIQSDRQEQAEEHLAAGLRLQPHYPPFIEIKARFLVDNGQVFQALHLLKKAPPALATYPEYYSFLAALYQRLGQLPAAENLYQQLTALHPEKGVWWLGLAVTEEALGKTAQAMEAYGKADHSPDLDPELRGYVGTRLRG